MTKRTISICVGGILVCGMFLVGAVQASHSWGGYHWANTAGKVDLNLIDNCTSDWDGNLASSRVDWNSTHLALTTVPGSDVSKDRKRCQAVTGQVKVCNAAYGFNGWLGLASIQIDSNNHITSGVAKMNDSYSTYWTPEEKNHVMCQEVGHVFGLDHQDESGAALGTCMDYSSDPGSQHPNRHDYDQLDIIYNHLDSYDTAGGGGSGGGCNAPPGKGCNKPRANSGAWGVMVRGNNHEELYVESHPDGSKTITHVRLAN